MIAFSGIDGAGKSTQIEKLKDFLGAQGNKVEVFWSRGGYTPIFNLLKFFLNVSANKSVEKKRDEKRERNRAFSNPFIRKSWLNIAIIDLLFYYVIYIRIKELFGTTIICDRYIIDTELDFKLNFPEENVENWILWKLLEKIAKSPKVHFVLLIPVEESRIRSIKKNEPFPDSEEVLNKRMDLYTRFIKQEKNHIIELSGLNSIEEIHSSILNIIKKIR